jgi:hypothetical protein
VGKVRNLSVPPIPAEESSPLTTSGGGVSAMELIYRDFVPCHYAVGIENMIYRE